MDIEALQPPLIETAVASSLAVLLALLLRKPLRRRFGARLAYLVWAAVPLAPAPTTRAAAVIDPFGIAMSTEHAAAPEAAGTGTIPDRGTVAPIAEGPAEGHGSTNWPALAVSLWLLGALAAFATLWRQQWRFVRGLGALRAEGEGLLRARTAAGCPALIGALRPRIVLPVDFDERYDALERELVLAHERAHLARGDAIANALAAGLRCVFWFNPLIHWAAARFRFDQELACDAAVLRRFPQARRSYADAMLRRSSLASRCRWAATGSRRIR